VAEVGRDRQQVQPPGEAHEVGGEAADGGPHAVGEKTKPPRPLP